MVVLFSEIYFFYLARSPGSMNVDDFFDLNVLLHQVREPRTIKPRIDPREELTERQFK